MARSLLLAGAAAALTATPVGALRDLPSRHAWAEKLRRKRSDAPVSRLASPGAVRSTPGTANCTELWYAATVDHFSFEAPLTPDGNFTYAQRYFVYDKWWNRETGAIWFYNGNEADVTLYVDHSGIMWEHAQAAGALLVFAEHRFYGQSMPCGDAYQQCLRYLTHEQAQADYVDLIYHIQATYNVSQPAILFGGSYGGMLASWSRMKYPGVWAGAVAASAPILGFQGQAPAYDPTRYWAVVTRDATPAGGSAAACSANIRAAWDPLFAAGSTPAGRAQLASTFNLCSPPQGDADMFALASFILNAYDTLAMGSFPYASNYLSGGGDAPPLPPWPFRVACDLLADPGLAQPARSWELLAAVSASTGVFNNATQNVACYDLPTGDVFEDGIWDVQWCSETLCEETYFARNGVTDMFWPWSISNAEVEAHCQDKYGFKPRWNWIASQYGTGGGPPRGVGLGGSNIIFSNGAYDPWSSGGVVNLTSSTVSTAKRLRAGATTPARKRLADAVEAAAAAGVAVTSDASGGLTSVWIADGAHHVDLFFSNPADTPTITAARTVELAAIAQWTEEWYAQRGKGPAAAHAEL